MLRLLGPPLTAALSLAIACGPGCRSAVDGAPPAAQSASASAAGVEPKDAPVRAPVREGNVVARAVGEAALYVADEDRSVVRRVPLPIDIHAPHGELAMPGPPAQLLALARKVLVTVRAASAGAAAPGEPPELGGHGLLLVLEPRGPEGRLIETARIELPADAWGLAVTPDERLALVTSAWTHRVSAVDLGSAKKLWTVDVAREPRAVVVRSDGKVAYVTHLVRSTLTRIDAIDDVPVTRDVAFPAAPLRTPPGPGRAEAATLSWSAVLSPDGARLFVPRQALGATGKRAWNGQATVDVLLTSDETELARGPARAFAMWSQDFMRDPGASIFPNDQTVTGPGIITKEPSFVSGRAVVYRRSTATLLVASEGTDALVELDALSLDPSAKPLRTYPVGGAPELEIDEGFASIQPALATQHAWERAKPGATRCGAPAGVALSEDEGMAWVFCRSTGDLASVRLDPYDAGAPFEQGPIPTIHLGDDPLDEEAALGRRLFYDARDPVLSGRYACAGCHPEGRDDGHVWHEPEDRVHEADGTEKGRIEGLNLSAFPIEAFSSPAADRTVTRGAPRQTPMLAGRVRARGPYGWKGRSPDLRHRVITGFVLHRWMDDGFQSFGTPAIARAEPLAAFLRRGLLPPPRDERAPTAEEQRGRAVFHDPAVGCASCHAPADGEYGNRALVGLGPWRVNRYEFDVEKENTLFKTPSLRFVGGTPPYYHDGSASTLEALIENNGRRMGHTAQLSKGDRAALVAFLRTL